MRLMPFARLLLVLALVCASAVAHAAERPAVTIGVLKFGTVSWELDVIRHHRLDEAAGFELKLMELASGQAAQIALQGGAVDMIASDWLWVAR